MKSKLILEFEENDSEKIIDVKVEKMAVQDVCFSVGVLLKKITEEKFDNKLDRLFFKLQAVQEICTALDLATIAKSIENAINQAKELQ